MPVEDAGREQLAVAHEVQHRLDERAEVLHHRWEQRRRLQPGDHLAERAEKGRLAAGERLQRTFDHEVHQHHARLFVGVVHGRRDAGLCRGAQTRIAALRVSEAVPADLEPQQVLARASVDPERRGARRAAVVGLIRATDAGSATDTIAARAAARRSSPIAENTSAMRRPFWYMRDVVELGGSGPGGWCNAFRRVPKVPGQRCMAHSRHVFICRDLSVFCDPSVTTA